MFAAHDVKYRAALGKDLVALIKLYLTKLEQGLPEAFSTLRTAWQELCFSFIFAVRTAAVKGLRHYLPR